MRRIQLGLWSLTALLCLGCEGKAKLDGVEDSVAPPAAGGEAQVPVFEPVELHRAVEKVKRVTTGLPLTADELSRVTQDPSALESLTASWLASPEGQAPLKVFFTYAFQQKLLTQADLVDQLGGINTRPDARLLANVVESYARTVLELVNEDRPFHETMTTRTFMVTPALLSLLATIDSRYVNDLERATDRMTSEFGVTAYTAQSTTVIPVEDSINPASPNFMRFYVPSFPNCPVSTTDSTPRTTRVVASNLTINLFNLMLGLVLDERDRTGLVSGQCGSFRLPASPLVDSDFTTWRMVRIRPPAAGEKPAALYELNKFRTASEVVLRIPRIGFFSTPSFFANWPTNDSNVSRVTANQSLIVALGLSIEMRDTTVPLSEPALDSEHASPGTECYGCHRTLDPMRQVFRRTYTLGYHEQTDAKQLAIPSVFTYGGVSRPTDTISQYAAVLAEHPLFALAWTRKFCHFVNSASCSSADPEILRIAEEFQKSNFNFRVLARLMLTSPLTTGLSKTRTHEERGETLSVARKDQFCALLALRLKIPNPCTLNTIATRITATFPEDGYSRGSEVPLTISDTTLFYRSGTENLCVQLAGRVVDATGSLYGSTAARLKDSITGMVHNLMGLPPGDPRSEAAVQILTEHYDAALAQTQKPTDALRSTFVLACSSPAVVGVGL